MRPLTSHDADRIAGQVAKTGQRLTRRTGRTTALAATARRATDWTPGIASALGKTGGRQPGAVSDPTGQAVVNAERRTRPPGEEVDPDATNERHAGWDDQAAARWPIELAMAARRLEAAALLVEKLMDRIDSQTVQDRHQPVQCKQQGCDVVIETKLSEYALNPNCPDCYRWLVKHDATMVPATVLADRRRKRTQRARIDA
jgi:hypothetical protein